MAGSLTNVQRTLVYGREKLARQSLILAAALLVLGVIGVSLDNWPEVAKFGWMVGGVGVVRAFVELFIRQSLPGKPLLELSAEGLSLHTPGARSAGWT